MENFVADLLSLKMISDKGMKEEKEEEELVESCDEKTFQKLVEGRVRIKMLLLTIFNTF